MTSKLGASWQMIHTGPPNTRHAYTTLVLLSAHGRVMQQATYPGHLDYAAAHSAFEAGLTSLFPDRPF